MVKQHLLKTFGRCDDVIFKTFYGALGNFEGGATTDVIPEGYGEYGLCATNPIPVQGIAASEVYLGKLRLESGEKITWNRLGSTSAPNINNCIDMYVIKSSAGIKVATLCCYSNPILRSSKDVFSCSNLYKFLYLHYSHIIKPV